MTYSHACARTTQFVGAAVLATALAATVVGPMAQGLEHQKVKAAYQSVSVPLLALTAVESNIQLATSPSTATLQSPTAGAQAAVTAKDTASDFLNSIVRTVAIGASYLTLPLWWIAFPVTFPLGYFYAQSRFTPANASGCFGYGGLFCGLNNLLAAVQSVFFGPVYIVQNLFPPTTASAGASTTSTAAATRRPMAVGTINAGPRNTQATIASRDNAYRQASVNSASTKSKRAAKSAAAESKSKIASAASKRRAAG